MRKRIRLGLGLGLGGKMSGSRLELLQMKKGKVRVMGRVRVACLLYTSDAADD